MKRVRRWLPIAAVGAAVLACVGAWLGLLWFESTYDQPYARVEDGLYIGSAVDRPPRGTQAVVNLCGRPDPYQVEATLWEPVFEAGKEPTLDWLRRVVGFIAEQRRAGRTTFVHCMAGMNRSGAAVTAYLMQEHGWARDEALTFLQKKRPEVQPNPTLMRLLAEWEQGLKAEPLYGLDSQ
jgi:Dual specificity phosphatase, catalytic domain